MLVQIRLRPSAPPPEQAEAGIGRNLFAIHIQSRSPSAGVSRNPRFILWVCSLQVQACTSRRTAHPGRPEPPPTPPPR